MTPAIRDTTGAGPEGAGGNSLPVQVGPYRILSLLGRGGMGVVYEAEHTATGQRVALKTVGATNAPTLMAIRTEVAASRAVRHPGVIRILEEGIHEGLPWYAMELLLGRTLAHFNAELWPGSGDNAVTASTMSGGLVGSRATSDPSMESVAATTAIHAAFTAGMLPLVAAGRLKEAATFYRLLCAPLGHIHARGMVHRDLKPSNVFIRSDGSPVIMDFGLMSLASGGVGREALSVGGKVAGTVRYVSPEQIQGRFVDARADLYAFGCMLYETLTGRPPFVGDRASHILDGHLSVSPIPPSRLVSGVPVFLEELVLRLLSKKPQDRLGHTDDVAAILSELAADDGVAAPPETENQCHLYRPQLAGRQDALAELLEYLHRLTQGSGALLLLGGESGIGKTFLVSEFGRSASLRGTQVVAGECLPSLGGEESTNEAGSAPLQPFKRLLQRIADQCREMGAATTQRLLGARAALLAPYEPALARLAADEDKPETLPSQAARDRLLGCLEETLAAFATKNPLVLVLDDLQWADDLSLSLLMSLRPSFFKNLPLLILGTYRSEEVSPRLRELIEGPVAQSLTLGRLDRATIRSIVGEMLAITEPPSGLVDFLSRTSEGNPFFVAEYLRLLVAEGVLHRSGGRWVLTGDMFDEATAETLPVPRSLQDIINRRLDGLSEDTRMLVGAGAVLGREFEIQLLADILGLDVPAILAPLRESAARRILEETEDGRYRYVHDKLLEACYQQLPADRRQRLHGEAAKAIEGRLADTPRRPHALAELAHHFKHAGNRAKALEYVEQAGSEAFGKSANREAAAFFKQALDLADVEGMETGKLRRARWCRQVGDALQGIGELDESAVYFRRALAILGWPAPGTGRLSQGLAVVGQLLRQFFHRVFPPFFLEGGRKRSEELLEAARAYDRLQQVYFYQGDAILPMLHACVASLNLAERALPSVELATAYSNAHVVASILPAQKLAEAYFRRARETLVQTSGPAGVADVNAETYLGVTAGVRLGRSRRLDRGQSGTRPMPRPCKQDRVSSPERGTRRHSGRGTIPRWRLSGSPLQRESPVRIGDARGCPDAVLESSGSRPSLPGSGSPGRGRDGGQASRGVRKQDWASGADLGGCALGASVAVSRRH